MSCECLKYVSRTEDGKRKRIFDTCYGFTSKKYKIEGSIASIIINACYGCIENIKQKHRNWKIYEVS